MFYPVVVVPLLFFVFDRGARTRRGTLVPTG